MLETLIYKIVSLATVTAISLLWYHFSKGKLALPKQSLVLVVLLSAPLIYLYPTGVFACQVCGRVYVVQHIIVGVILFALLALLLRLVVGGRAT
jgi:hypothetical protein